MKTKEEIRYIIKKNVDSLLICREGSQSECRLLGALETLLMTLNILQPGQKFEYQTIEYKGFFGQVKYRKETYKELILRIVKENIN